MTLTKIRLGDLLEVQNGFAFNSKQFSKTSGMPLIRIRDLKNGISTKTYYKGNYENKYIVRAGDFLISMDGEFRCYQWRGKNGLLNQRVCRLQNFNKQLNPNFLYYIINKELKLIEDKTGFITVKHLSSYSIKEIQISLPPLTQQKRIVNKLDIAFTEIDKKIDRLNKNIKNLEELIVKFISREIEKLDKSNFKKISSLCDLTRGPFGGSLTKAMFVKKGFAVYEQKHAIRNNFETIKYYIDEKKFNEMKRFELRPGDLLMSCSGTLGKIAVVPEKIKKGIINQALLKITPNKSIISKEYLKLIITSNYFQKILWKLSEGTAQINVPSVKILKDILIPVPDIKKQKEIISKISTLNNIKLGNLYNRKKSLIESLKISMINKFIIIKNKAA